MWDAQNSPGCKVRASLVDHLGQPSLASSLSSGSYALCVLQGLIGWNERGALWTSDGGDCGKWFGTDITIFEDPNNVYLRMPSLRFEPRWCDRSPGDCVQTVYFACIRSPVYSLSNGLGQRGHQMDVSDLRYLSAHFVERSSEVFNVATHDVDKSGLQIVVDRWNGSESPS